MRRLTRIAAAVVAVAALMLIDVQLMQVFAQTPTVVVAPAPEPTLWQQLFSQLSAAVYPLISVAVGGALLWLSTWVKAKFKIEVDAGLRETLHSAIMSGILFGLKRLGYSNMGDGTTLTDAQKADVAATALAYVKSNNPETVAALKATDSGMSKIAEGKLEGLLAGLIVPAVPGAAPAPPPPPAP